MSLIIINDVPCPYCHAEAGERCVVAHRPRDGVTPPAPSPRPRPHEQRRLAFRIARASRSGV